MRVPQYIGGIPERSKVTEEQINMACRHVLEAKYKLGLFDNPYKYCDPKRPARDIFTKAHRDAARRIAAESFVLLKNDSPDGNPNGIRCCLSTLKEILQ